MTHRRDRAWSDGGAARRGARGAQAFSLIEILLAVTLGALLMVSLAEAVAVFGKNVEELRDEQDTALEQTVTTIGDAVRRGWWVERDSATSLSITDPYGAVTRFFLQDGELVVRRPSGAEGPLLDDVTSLDFTVETMQRLRDDTPLDEYGTWWADAPAGAAGTLTLEPGDQLALGFTASADAPADKDVVAGVEEELASALLEGLALSAVGQVDTSPKTFCHLHASPPHNSSHSAQTGVLSIDLYEARAPGDGTPFGPLLASTTLPTSVLPSATVVWWDTNLAAAVSPPNGVAWGWWNNNPQVVLQLTPVVAPATIDLVPLSASIEPGRAYTLVVGVSGYTSVTFDTVALPSATFSGVSHRPSGAASWAPQALGIVRDLRGTASFTQTAEHQAVSRVIVTIERGDGSSLSGSATVLGQAEARDPWQGVVDGELPTLQLAGT